MKTKLFVSAKKAEIRVPEGKSISKLAKESVEDFKARAITEIAADNLIDETEVQIQVVDEKAVKKFKDEQIVEQYLKEAANQKSAKFALLKETLELREIELPEITAEMIAEAKAAGKPAKVVKEKVAKEPKEPKVKKVFTTEEVDSAKENIGKIISFEKAGKAIKGEVTAVIEDKRVGRFYFRLKPETGGYAHVLIDAKELTFTEKPAAPVVEKPAKKEKAKKDAEVPAKEIPAVEAEETSEGVEA